MSETQQKKSNAETQKRYRERQKVENPEYLKEQAQKKKEYRDKKREQLNIGGNLMAKSKLEELFKNMKTRKDKPLSEISIKNYIAKLNTLSRLVDNKDYEDHKFLLDPEKVIDLIKHSNLRSKKDYVTPIIKVLENEKVDADIIKKYKNNLSDHKVEEDKERGENKLRKEKDKDNVMSVSEINKKIDEYKIDKDGKIDPNRLVYKLIVCFYFRSNVVLRNDLPLFKIATSKKKDYNEKYNYIVFKGNEPDKIIMNQYKTSPTYGKQTFDITSDLKELLKIYCKIFKKEAGDYLFSNGKDKEINKSTFLRYIEKSMVEVLGKPLNIDLIRSILISDFYSKPRSINEKKEFSNKFLHSSKVAEEYVKLDIPT
jgi:hypothetical protein